MNLQTIWIIFKDTFFEWQEDRADRLAAALAYYTVFSLAPLVIIVLGIVGFLFGQQAVGDYLLQQMQGLVGEEGAQVFQTIMTNSSQPSSSLLATLIGIGTLLFGALGVFGQLQDSLNTVWGVTAKPGRGVWGFIETRILSFTMLLAIGFLLLVSLVLSSVLSAFTGYLNTLLADFSGIFLQVLNFVISFGVITLLFAMIYKILPDVEIKWSDVWVGAAVTSLLFSIGKYLLGLYLGYQSFGSTYGAAGSILIILLWVYYSAQILLFGAEFTQVYARRFGSQIVPDEDAVLISPEMRAEQGMPSTEEVEAAQSAQGQRPAHSPAPQKPVPPTPVNSQTLYVEPESKPNRVVTFLLSLLFFGLFMRKSRAGLRESSRT